MKMMKAKAAKPVSYLPLYRFNKDALIFCYVVFKILLSPPDDRASYNFSTWNCFNFHVLNRIAYSLPQAMKKAMKS